MDDCSGKEKKILPKQWERFQTLKARRERVTKKTLKQSTKKMTRSALKEVSKHITVEDVKDVLQWEGVNVTMTTKQEVLVRSESPETEVGAFLDPADPHLAVTKETTRLESELNNALKYGKFEEAVQTNDELIETDFASKVVTAIERQRYVKEKELEEAKRRKRPKLKWRYEHKQRWETKSNM